MIEFRGGRWVVPQGDPSEDELRARLPAFTPGWNPGASGPGRAILAIAARLAAVIAERLVRAPDKAKLVLLDTLGVAPIPPQPAHCPVVFEMLPGAGHGRVPERTRLAAQSAAGGEPLVFETVSPIGLAASRLMEVKAALPGDQYADYTAAALGEQPFTLFDQARPVPRELYLGYDRLFAFTPGAVVELQVQLGRESGAPVGPVVWEYWDGTGWVWFAPERTVAPAPTAAGLPPDVYSQDGTENLRRSGTIRLRAGERPAAPNTIRGAKRYWVRGRLQPPDRQRPPVPVGGARPQIDRLVARTLQTVGGFRVLGRVGTPVAPDPQAPTRPDQWRKFWIRLVDDSGSPLAVQPAGVQQYWVFARVPGRARGWLLTTPDPAGFLTLTPGDAAALDVRVSTGELRPDGAPTTPGQMVWDLPRIDGLTPDRSWSLDLARAGRLPDLAFANGRNVDPSTTFLPFGPQPLPGSTFLFTNAEVMGKPGARVRAFTEVADLPPAGKDRAPVPDVRWEFWNGLVWAPLPDFEATPEVRAFRASGSVRFTLPANLAAKTEFGQEKPWLRLHLADGDYRVPGAGTVGVPDPTAVSTGGTREVHFDKVFPPVVQKFRLEYEYTSPPEPPQVCLTFNDFRWDDVSDRVRFGGNPFAPFGSSPDTRPALYLGFSRTLPADLISLFWNVSADRPEPELQWEYWDGNGWRLLALDLDQTQGLSTPGLVQFVWPGTSFPDPQPAASAQGAVVTLPDLQAAARFRGGEEIAIFQDDDAEAAQVAAVKGTQLTLAAPLEKRFTAPLVGKAPLARFGTPRHWVRLVWPRAEYPRPGEPGAVTVSGLYLNAVAAEQTQTQQKEILGTTTGVGGEAFDFAQAPVLPGEVVEVLELDGPLAGAEWSVLQKELRAAGKADALQTETDPKTKQVVRAWVRWEGRPNFAASGPADRHYVVDRIRGRLYFGDGKAGRVPPALPNNVRATYQAGGGRKGNVGARQVRVVLGSVPGAQQVLNPVPAAGGADGEFAAGTDGDPTASILARGPQFVRHRGRAVTAADYEQLARTASAGVAIARAVTPEDSGCLVPAGTVQVLIVPYADETDPQPRPDRVLSDQVRGYLRARAPATVTDVVVTGPPYFPVGVEAVLVPREQSDAGRLARQAKQALARFLHPVVGGVDLRRWGSGRIAIYPSEVVARLHRELGDLLAYVETLRLLDAGVPVAEPLEVPPGQLPCAGPVRVLLSTGGVCR